MVSSILKLSQLYHNKNSYKLGYLTELAQSHKAVIAEHVCAVVLCKFLTIWVGRDQSTRPQLLGNLGQLIVLGG
jgi:hypothetical protein